MVPVPEAYTAELKPGAEIPFWVAAYPSQTWSGTIARIARAVDVSTRTMAVELDVVNSDGRLAPGTFCQVRWPIRRSAPSLFVPSGSVAATTDRIFVVRPDARIRFTYEGVSRGDQISTAADQLSQLNASGEPR